MLHVLHLVLNALAPQLIAQIALMDLVHQYLIQTRTHVAINVHPDISSKNQIELATNAQKDVKPAMITEVVIASLAKTHSFSKWDSVKVHVEKIQQQCIELVKVLVHAHYRV